RSLVRDITTDRASRLVVEATVALSRNLGLATLAEGAEDEAQMTLLEELGCQYVQGFGIARPMSFDDTSAWLAAHLQKLAGTPAKSA
ncbi:MAG: EAL domain-containing protein, partial [Pseudomonadota bacterium]